MSLSVRSLFRVALCAVPLLLCASGCRSKPAAAPDEDVSQPSPQVTPSSPAEEDTRPVVVAFGDSLTAGYGTNPGQSYPDYLQTYLDQQGFHYRVVNAGVSGNTTKDAINRLPDVLDLHPKIVIVAFGGNDGLRGWPIETTRHNLETIISTLQQSGAKVVLGGITLPRNYGAEYIRQFDETYVLMAKEFHVPLLPFLLKGVYGTPGSMQGDGIHATAQGNQQVARNLLPLVEPLLTRNEGH